MQDLGTRPFWAVVLLRQRAESTVLRHFFDEDVLAKWPIWLLKTAVKYWSLSVYRMQGIITVYFLFGGTWALLMCPLATSMFTTISTLLWWTLDSVPRTFVIKAKRCIWSSTIEIPAASASAKLRQTNRNDKRIELTMQLLHSCWTTLSFEERLM